jgi:dipeptidyl aminopeptidase/acylaminoacyl peptidase
MDPGADRYGEYALGGAVSERVELARKASPVCYISQDDPPLLVFHGSEDKRVNVLQAKAFGEALDAADAKYELIIVEGAGHGRGYARAGTNAKRMEDFFAKHLQPQPPDKADDPAEG